MFEYGNFQYASERSEPSELFLKARQIAGCHLQEQFKKFNRGVPDLSNNSFKWIKSELTHPTFDHLTFAFKNVIFSVLIELADENQTSLTRNQIERLVKATEENNLIPCVFRLRMKSKQENSFSGSFKPENLQQYHGLEMAPVNKEWNLYDIETGVEITPDKIGSEMKIAMSTWELSNSAIQIVKNDIENKGGSVLSFCDLLEVNPQVWFRDKQGRIGWIVAKHISQLKEGNHLDWLGLECKYPQLLPFDGFFAGVQFDSMQHNELIRGDSLRVKYAGLQRIYVS